MSARTLVVAGVVALSACDSGTPPAKATSRASARSLLSDAGSASASQATTAEVPATRAVAELPPDPGGCLISGCHPNLVQVAYRHGPIQSGACDACHEAEQPGHKFPLKRPGRETCTFCHQVTGHREHVHAVIEKQGCLPCHNPHGSDTKFLLTDASIELTCRHCHTIERKAYLHGPFASGQCTSCHQPHESDNRFLLAGGEGAEHCLTCHKIKRQQMLAGKLHKPVEDGCTRCHEPHSGDNKHMLVAPLEELCFECHHDIEDKVAAASSPHGAVITGDRCGNCHDPHVEGRPFLLRDELRTLCLTCHDKPQRAYDGRTIPDMRPALTDRKYLHGPVRAGECNACHEVHGATRAKLLRRHFPEQFYEAFDLANYALCFGCHSQSIVLEKETTTLTNFRDGERNLHFVHVNRPDKGRTCRTCHEIHGSNLPRHMASAVPFEGGGWSMPIKFEQTDAGGRCSPGCHEPREYRRTRVAPPPARTGGSGAPER